MDQNELLQKPRLGRCLERGYTLPPGTTFGHANYKQDGGTGRSLTLRDPIQPLYHLYLTLLS